MFSYLTVYMLFSYLLVTQGLKIKIFKNGFWVLFITFAPVKSCRNMINVLTLRATITVKLQYGHVTTTKIKPLHEIIPV
jgi:hypothetical protein